MSTQKKLSEKEILKLISQLRENPNNKQGLLADLGIAGAGMAGAGAVAAVAGAGVAPIGFGITALTGFGLAVAAPVGLVAGAAVAGGAAAYGVTQAVRFKARQQGRCEQMIQQLNEMLRDEKYQKTKSQTTASDKTKFILFLEDPIKLKLMSHEDASDLIQLVEGGQLSLFEAYRLVKDILKEASANRESSPTALMPKLLNSDTTSSDYAVG